MRIAIKGTLSRAERTLAKNAFKVIRRRYARMWSKGASAADGGSSGVSLVALGNFLCARFNNLYHLFIVGAHCRRLADYAND
jgi:hypothetical protein